MEENELSARKPCCNQYHSRIVLASSSNHNPHSQGQRMLHTPINISKIIKAYLCAWFPLKIWAIELIGPIHLGFEALPGGDKKNRGMRNTASTGGLWPLPQTKISTAGEQQGSGFTLQEAEVLLLLFQERKKISEWNSRVSLRGLGTLTPVRQVPGWRLRQLAQLQEKWESLSFP